MRIISDKDILMKDINESHSAVEKANISANSSGNRMPIQTFLSNILSGYFSLEVGGAAKVLSLQAFCNEWSLLPAGTSVNIKPLPNSKFTQSCMLFTPFTTTKLNMNN